MKLELEEIKHLNSLLDKYIDNHVNKDFSILQKSEDPYLIVNRDGQVVYVNDLCVTLLEYDKPNLLHINLIDLFNSTLLNKNQTFFLDKSIQTLNNFDSQLNKQSGQLINVNLTTFPINFKNEIIGSYVVIKDISLVKKESQLLSKKQAIAGQLAAGIAHEIRNPITAIKGFLQLMMEKEHQKESTYFNIIDSEIGRIEEILKELMVLAKPAKVKYQNLDIRLLVEQVLLLMESHGLLNNVEFEKSFNFGKTMVLGDENQLKQVFINYIKNAIEAMSEGGKLTIEGDELKENDCIRIRIIDQGCGIPAEILERIHEPFFTTKEQGTGLGMSVCYQIIEEHNGSVTINSNSEGTCVEVNLPKIIAI